VAGADLMLSFIIKIMQAVQQFKTGVIDSLRIPDAIITILSDNTLRNLTIKSTILNGVFWLGSILVYQFIICQIISSEMYVRL
jgi:hypothetical protein